MLAWRPLSESTLLHAGLGGLDLYKDWARPSPTLDLLEDLARWCSLVAWWLPFSCEVESVWVPASCKFLCARSRFGSSEVLAVLFMGQSRSASQLAPQCKTLATASWKSCSEPWVASKARAYATELTTLAAVAFTFIPAARNAGLTCPGSVVLGAARPRAQVILAWTWRWLPACPLVLRKMQSHGLAQLTWRLRAPPSALRPLTGNHC